MVEGMRVQRAAPIRHQVAGLLRAAIVDLRLPPGRALVERELCELTGASRPSVREALRQLETEGLVVSVPGRGTRVATVGRSDARHVYEVRAALEGVAARGFTTHATPAQRVRLRDAVDAMAGVRSSTGDLLAAKDQFYAALFDGCGNPVVAQLLETLHRRVTALRATTLAQPRRRTESLDEIGRILAAIEAGDPAAAERASIEHVHRAELAALASLSDDHPGLSTVEEAG